MNAQVIQIKGRDVLLAYHPQGGEPRIGQALLLQERSPHGANKGLVAQVIGYDSAGYPGDREVALGELLESAIAERHEVVQGEPALGDLKEIKLARCKIRKMIRDAHWLEWDGTIPSRNVRVTPIDADDLLAHVVPGKPAHSLGFAAYEGQPVSFEAALLDKVNALVGYKGSGKSHNAKLLLMGLAHLGAPCWAFDINREFVDLPGADTIRVGDNYRLSLAEVGFEFLAAVIDDIGPMPPVSQGALDHEGRRFMEEELRKRGFASIDYLLDRAEAGRFHHNEWVNLAIETRLRMVKRSAIFSDDPGAETLTERFARATETGGFLVFDLAEMPVGRLKALTRGLNRRLDAICVEERTSGSGRYPFVFFEEAHFYAAPGEILNLITRGRHLGLTTFFITNSPGELPEVIFRQLDNLIVTGLSHSADLRTIAKSSVSDEDTLQSLAMSLGPQQALVVGRLTGHYPLVVEISALPEDWPATGRTRSFWNRDLREAA
jgi:hypothetical protein